MADAIEHRVQRTIVIGAKAIQIIQNGNPFEGYVYRSTVSSYAASPIHTNDTWTCGAPRGIGYGR